MAQGTPGGVGLLVYWRRTAATHRHPDSPAAGDPTPLQPSCLLSSPETRASELAREAPLAWRVGLVGGNSEIT